jgi:thioredoxin reductase (NADPH)
VLDLVVVGAGPCGLSTAVAAAQAGMDCLVFDRGSLCHSIARFPTHLTFFSTPELLEIGGLPFALDHKPMRHEVLTYYRRVAQRYELRLRLYEAVTEIRRDGAGFTLITPRGAYRARAVTVATGFFDNPRRLGIPGEDLPHVSHYYTEAHPFFARRVVVVGGGNSAVEAALDLYRAGARVTLVHRGAQLPRNVKYWLLPDIENRIREGSVAALFRARPVRIDGEAVEVEVEGEASPRRVPADAVFLLTGYAPDYGLLRSLGVTVGERPQFDPATHETDVPGVYVAGVQTDPGSIIEEGRLHGPRIVRHLAGVLGRSG